MIPTDAPFEARTNNDPIGAAFRITDLHSQIDRGWGGDYIDPLRWKCIDAGRNVGPFSPKFRS
jgi:hypothetical protein